MLRARRRQGMCKLMLLVTLACVGGCEAHRREADRPARPSLPGPLPTTVTHDHQPPPRTPAN